MSRSSHTPGNRLALAERDRSPTAMTQSSSYSRAPADDQHASGPSDGGQRSAKRAKLGSGAEDSQFSSSARSGKENRPPYRNSQAGPSTSTPVRARPQASAPVKKQTGKPKPKPKTISGQRTIKTFFLPDSTSSQQHPSQAAQPSINATGSSKGNSIAPKKAQTSAPIRPAPKTAQPDNVQRKANLTSARLPDRVLPRAKGKARAQEPDRRSPTPTRSGSEAENNLPDTMWEPPSTQPTWQKNFAGKVHLYRMVNGLPPEEEDPVFTQVPGNAGKKQVRTISRQLDYEAHQKAQAQRKAEAERGLIAMRQRLNGNEVRPLAMHRGRYAPQRKDGENKDPGPSRAAKGREPPTPTQDSGSTAPQSPFDDEDEQVDADDDASPEISPTRYKPVDLEQRLNAFMSRRNGEGGSQSARVPCKVPPNQGTTAGRQNARTFVCKTETVETGVDDDHDTLSESSFSSGIAPALPQARHQSVISRPVLQPTPVRNGSTYSGSTASGHGLSSDAEMGPEGVDQPSQRPKRTQREPTPSYPQTMVSESLLDGLLASRSSGERSPAHERHTAHSTSTPPHQNHYVLGADIRDGFAGISPTSMEKVLAYDTQCDPSWRQRYVSAGARDSLRNRKGNVDRMEEGDEDVTMVGSPDKGSASTKRRTDTGKRKRRTQKDVGKVPDLGSQQTLSAFAGYDDKERERKEREELERVESERRNQEQMERMNETCDRVQGKTDGWDEDEDDVDKTKVEDGPSDFGSGLPSFAGRGASSSPTKRARIHFKGHHLPSSTGERSYSGDRHHSDLAKAKHEEAMAALKNEDAIMAAKQEAISEGADETQPLEFSQSMDSGGYQSTSSESVGFPMVMVVKMRERVSEGLPFESSMDSSLTGAEDGAALEERE
ncbi:hypothetical protein A4X13_0g2143 [Tilletia indica]|uniref:Uncharacterized protein n=1 Tax=Tilletia indica TaxID=43049 RepID=A0A177TNI4_9BASI|nr:hypothetical protein A4X13_0g2143 [Tilletia indica]